MLFSIITVTYNAASVIEPTLKSVSEQSFRDFEHLIIDGASSDNTLQLTRLGSFFADEVVECFYDPRFIPFPIHLPESCNTVRVDESKVVIFIGINRERSAYKGTDIMLQAAKDVLEKYPDRMKLNIAESVPFAEYHQMMNGSDAILDQLYAYTPSMNSLLAMSKGIICIGGGEPENYEIIDEAELRPIINVEPTYESVYHELEQLILHPERIPELKRQSVEYVRKHHDYIKIAQQYADLFS